MLRRATFPVLLVAALALVCCEQEDALVQLDPPAALVVTSDFHSGSYSAVRLADHQVAVNIDAIHEDAVCRYAPLIGLPLIVSRLGADAIELVDPARGWQVVEEYSVGAGSNPQDIAVVAPDRAYVSLLGEPALRVVHPVDGAELGSVELTAWADEDGLAEPTGMLERDGWLYVLLLRLASLLPTDESLLLKLDAATGEVALALPTTVANPSGKLRYSTALGGLLLIESGEFGALDGGLEIFDPETGTLSGLLVTEEALGGDLVDAVIASPAVGYAAIGETLGATGNTKVVRFDPSNGLLVDDLLVSDEWAHTALELTDDGTELWIADRTAERPGIRIFDALTGAELTAEPIDVGLPPVAICFVD